MFRVSARILHTLKKYPCIRDEEYVREIHSTETGRLGPKMEWTEPEADGGFQRN